MTLANLIIEMFGADEEKAQSAEEVLTDEGLFLSHFSQLEKLVGYDIAADVVKNGDFLAYRNGFFQAYMNLARQVHGRLIKEGKPIDAERFYSIKSLKQGENGNQGVSDTPALNTAKYRILHPDNEMSRRYLEALIERGELVVDGDEHWHKGKGGDKGPRGGDILKRVAYQLKEAFHELGLDSPSCELPQGQHRLLIDEHTKTKLREIRDMVYNKTAMVQNKSTMPYPTKQPSERNGIAG